MYARYELLPAVGKPKRTWFSKSVLIVAYYDPSVYMEGHASEDSVVLKVHRDLLTTIPTLDRGPINAMLMSACSKSGGTGCPT